MSIQLNIYTNENEFAKIPTVIKSLNEFKSWFTDYLNKNTHDYQCLIDKTIKNEVKDWLNSEDHDYAFDARNGITGGCYGARTGKSHEGLTVYIDPLQFPERWLDEDGTEIVNIAALLDDHATEMVDLDSDSFLEALEQLGLNIVEDNTCNYMGTTEDDPTPFQHVHFKCIQTGKDEYGCKMVVVSFHCGGDIRGNYSLDRVYKFEDAESFYTVFSPICELRGE